MATQPPIVTPPVPPGPPNKVPPPPPPATAGAGPGNPPGQPAEGEVLEQHSIWQSPFVLNVLPFLTSLVMHLGLVLVIVVVVKLPEIVDAVVNYDQIVIPDAVDSTLTGPPGGIKHPGLGGDRTRDAFQDQFPEITESTGIYETKSTTLSDSLMGGSSGEGDGMASIIAMGGRGGSGRGLGSGTGDGTGSGKGTGGGDLAPFGIPGGGGGIGPRSNFIGMGGNAHRIAYVCDASGSMLNMFDSLRMEIEKSVGKLSPVQSFNVFFFQNADYKTADRNQLMAASAAHKELARNFLADVAPSGQTNPIPALEAAFKQGPQLIYLLTDGDFDFVGNDKVVEFCREKTRDGRTKINTLAFIGNDDTDPQTLSFVKALKQIAADSGGTFKHVTDDDFHRW